MSKILIINPNTDTFGRQSIPTTYISGLLKKNHHEVELFDTTFYDIRQLFPKKISHEQLVSKLNFFKKVEYPRDRFEKKKVNIVKVFEEKVNRFRPDLIIFSFWGSHLYGEGEFFAYFYAEKLVGLANTGSIPIAVGGTVPTWSPELILKHPKIHLVARGESEFVFLDMANRLADDRSLAGIPNLWISDPDGNIMEKNPLRPLIEPLDVLPFADYDIYDDRLFYRPFHGKMKRCVDAELSRGCIFDCSFCLSPFQRQQYGVQKNQQGHPSRFRREKSIKRIVEEIGYLKNRYRLDMIRYQDESFLSMKTDKLNELSKAYKKHVDLPFIVEAVINTVTEEKINALKEMGCVSISLGIESGNPWLRKAILKKPSFANETAIRKIRMINAAGISYNLFNIIGFPDETPKMVFDTIQLNYRIKPPYTQVSFFQPWEGTKLREYCIKKGLLRPESTGLENSQDTLTPSAMENTAISKKDLQRLHDTFIYYVYINKIFWPLITLVTRKGFLPGLIRNLFTRYLNRRIGHL